VLKPNGRLMISDMVLLKEMPEAVKKSVLGYIACISGAEMKAEYIEMIKNAGFKEVDVVEETLFPPELLLNDSNAKTLMNELNLTQKKAEELVKSVASIKISATKPQN
jgi:hypothetical protein